MSERARHMLALQCTLITGIILLAMAAAFSLVSQRQLSEKADASFQSDVNAILYHLRSQPVLDHTWLSQTENNGALILAIELNGAPLLYSGATRLEDRDRLVALAWASALSQGFDPMQPPDSRLQDQEVRFLFSDSGERFRAACAVVPLDSGWANITVVRSMAPERAQISAQFWAFGALTLLGLGLLALFSWGFAGHVLRPIQESQKKQAAFIAAASHELRSPLAVIHSGLTALQEAPPDRAEHFRVLADGECLRMSRLVGDLLSLANADSGSWSMLPGEVELETLVLTVCEGFEAQARQANIQLTPLLPAQPLPRCHCDGERVAQLLSILIDNGLSYTPAGGRVEVSISAGEGRFLLLVSDTGPGVPDDQKEQIFQRFYRADPSRRDRSHYGLGLSVAREIAALHNGSLTLSDAPGGGARFVFVLPQSQ